VDAEFIARARAAARGVSIFMPGGVGRRYPGLIDVKDLRGRGTTTASWPIENYYTAYDVAEGVDHTTSQAYAPTDTTATVTEKIAIETISRLAMETDQENAVQRAARMLGVALGEKIDSDILALNNTLDADVGSSGNDATFALFSNGPQALASANYEGPYVAVLHPHQWYDLANQGTTTVSQAAGVIADEIVTNYWVKRIAGADIIVTGRVPLANANADRSGAIFSGVPAYGLAELWWGDIEQEKDASLRGTEVVATACYGVVEIDGATAVAFETGAS